MTKHYCYLLQSESNKVNGGKYRINTLRELFTSIRINTFRRIIILNK